MTTELMDKINNASKIWFVCSGNIIRSALAEVYAKSLGIPNVDSYGTTYHNTSMHKKSIQEAKRLKVPKEIIKKFISTHIDNLDQNEIKQNDQVHIVMTDKHKQDLLRKGIPEGNIVKITQILGKTHDVADPYFENNWDEAYSTIKDAVDHISAKMT